ncbi:MAG TPA: hypothetical protein PLF40_20575, partial [Kofleriaceae bacterium]|nr:hypothetical protein [Kofleriaceae bacterium]
CGPEARTVVDGRPIDAPKAVDSPDGSTVLDSLVYAHTGNHLYRIDTVTNLPVDIGPITGLAANESVTDLAVDKTGKIVGIGFKNLYSINKDTGAATLIKTLPVSSQGFTSLSYVPTNLQDMNSTERLVAANNDGDVFSIDPATGDATPIGAYGVDPGSGKKIGSSGDIVAVYGAGIYATVNIGTSNTDRDKPDYLAKINPATWAATMPNADTGLDHIFGLAYWKGKVYGFVDVPDTGAGRTGKFVQLDPNTGAATELKNGPEAWFGAGVTTLAPIVE